MATTVLLIFALILVTAVAAYHRWRLLAWFGATFLILATAWWLGAPRLGVEIVGTKINASAFATATGVSSTQ